MTATRRTGLSLDAGEATWDVLSERLDALIHQWDLTQTPPVLAEYVPAGDGPSRRLLLSELIKVDLDYRWKFGKPRRVEEYLAEFPDLAGPSGIPCDLIFEEFQLRRRACSRDNSPAWPCAARIATRTRRAR